MEPKDIMDMCYRVCLHSSPTRAKEVFYEELTKHGLKIVGREEVGQAAEWAANNVELTAAAGHWLTESAAAWVGERAARKLFEDAAPSSDGGRDG